MKQLHIFDMDNTLIDTDCDVTWKEFLVAKGIAPADALETADRFFQDYNAGCLDKDAFNLFQLAEFIGSTVEEMAELTKLHFEECIRSKVRAKALTHVRSLIDAGIPVAMLTSTNEVIAKPVAEFFGFKEFFGAPLEVVNNRYTGKIDGVYPAGSGKLFYFGLLCGRHNVLPQNCAAYGDSINDAPLLEACGEAHAVSPSDDLRKLATAKNWLIDEWRA